jgi:hypothetical protein
MKPSLQNRQGASGLKAQNPLGKQRNYNHQIEQDKPVPCFSIHSFHNIPDSKRRPAFSNTAA